MNNILRSKWQAAFFAPIAMIFFAVGIQAFAGADDDQSSKLRIRYFCGKGEVVSVDKEAMSVTIKHEDIEGFMAAMTMRFKAEEPDVIEGISPGDRVRFTLKDMPDKYRLVYIEKIETKK